MSLMKWLFAAAVLIQTFLPGATHASVIQRPLSLSEMTSQADGIFLGQVVSRVGTRAATRGEIFTEVTIRVQSSLKGRSERDGHIRVLLPGGEVGGEVEIFRGAASFTPGEQVLVFLSKDQPGTWQVLGMAQGKYSVRETAGQTLAVNEPAGVLVLLEDSNTRSLHSIEAPSRQVPLEELLREVKQSLAPPLVMR